MAANLNQYLTQGAMAGFIVTAAALQAFSYVVKPNGAALNDNIRVPFVNTSGSNTFTYANGYNTDSNDIVGKNVQLNSILFQKISLTDADLTILNPEAIVKVGYSAGAKLASDVVSASIASVVTQANFGNSGSYTSTNFTSSVALAALDKFANDNAWPDSQRSLICGTTLWQSLMNNSTITNAANFGNTGPIQQGKLNSVLGFSPYKVSFALPNSDTGFAVNPNAILFGNAYHAPQESGVAYIAADQITDETTGLTIGFRQYYSPDKATSVRVFDCLSGVGLGNSNALYHIK